MSEKQVKGTALKGSSDKKPISSKEAFSLAPPRSPAVLCFEERAGEHQLVLTEWFSWLNFTRNPMISFSMPRGSKASSLREGDSFLLAIPPVGEAERFQKEVVVMAGSEEENSLPALSSFEGHFIPKGTTVVLLCTLAGAYNYPFKKVRIFNCNLEQAFRMR